MTLPADPTALLDLDRLDPKMRAKVERALTEEDQVFSFRAYPKAIAAWKAEAERCRQTIKEWAGARLNEGLPIHKMIAKLGRLERAAVKDGSAKVIGFAAGYRRALVDLGAISQGTKDKP